MRLFIYQLIGFLPNLLWFKGSHDLGNRKRKGWAYLFLSEVMWVIALVVVHWWFSLVWCFVGFWMYAHNYRKWKSNVCSSS